MPEEQSTPTAPFSCSFSPNIPELLNRLNCTLAISTYQAGKIVFISPKDNDHLVQLPRTFPKPMGIALDDNGEKMALACKDEITIFRNSPALANTYPGKPNTYDALYMPRATHYVGPVDIHDLMWGNDGLYAVNTLFSVIAKIDHDFSFNPYWKPPFITDIVPEDRCHLNGMAMVDGKPKYATAFNQGNTIQSWREVVTTQGILMDIQKNEILISGLAMPHSPRIFKGKLYLLLSATGELIVVDPENNSYDQVCQFKGFVRGMSHYNDYVFIAISKLRKNSSTFAKLAIANESKEARIMVVHLPSGSIQGEIKYHTSVDEIYDIQVLPNKKRPNIMSNLKSDHKLGVVLPKATYWAKQDKKD